MAFNHTGLRGFFFFADRQDPVSFSIALAASILCKIAVPLFFMCSGALLLNREESYGKLFRHRVLRMLAVLILYSVFGYLYQIHFDLTAFSTGYFFKTMYSSKITDAGWFLYAYLAALFLLPLLRKMARNMTAKEGFYLLALQVFFIGILLAVEYIFSRNAIQLNLTLPLLTDSLFYILMGHFAENILRLEDLTPKRLWFAAGLSLLCLIAAMALTVFKGGVDNGYTEGGSQLFHSTLIAIPTLTIYLLARKWVNGYSADNRWTRIANHLSELTFGIYLLHIFALWSLNPLYDALEPTLGIFRAMLVWLLAGLLVSGLATEILKRVPGLRKLL